MAVLILRLPLKPLDFVRLISMLPIAFSASSRNRSQFVTFVRLVLAFTTMGRLGCGGASGKRKLLSFERTKLFSNTNVNYS